MSTGVAADLSMDVSGATGRIYAEGLLEEPLEEEGGAFQLVTVTARLLPGQSLWIEVYEPLLSCYMHPALSLALEQQLVQDLAELGPSEQVAVLHVQMSQLVLREHGRVSQVKSDDQVE